MELPSPVWRPVGGKPHHFDFFGNIPVRAVFSGDGKRVFATDCEGRVGVWTTADDKRLGELDPNPVLLADQIAAVHKIVNDLASRVAAAKPGVSSAETEAATATAALDTAKKALETARADEAAKQAEVQRLSALLTNVPSDLPAGLAAESSAWGEARSKSTNAQATVEARSKEVESAKTKLAVAKALSPDLELVDAKAKLAHLEAAKLLSTAYDVREQLSVIKREHDSVAAVLESNRRLRDKAEKDLAAAKAAAAQAEAQINSAQAQVSTNEPRANQLATEMKAQQTHLEGLLNQYRSATHPPATLAKRSGL